jgi:serpin B
VQRGWSIQSAYLDTIAASFGADLKLVDYIADHEAARRAINARVSQQTRGRIRELLAPPNVTDGTRPYLVNAIYLKANWVVEFIKDETAPRSFRRLDGSVARVPTMRLTGGQEVPLPARRRLAGDRARYRGLIARRRWR